MRHARVGGDERRGSGRSASACSRARRRTPRQSRMTSRPSAASTRRTPRARSPVAKKQPVLHGSIFFVRVLRARDASRGEAVPGSRRGRGASGGGTHNAALTLQKGLDMWFMALSVYTTEYSSRPPAASNGRGDLWYGLDGSCGHCAANARSATRWGLNEPRAATARAAARRRANIGRTLGTCSSPRACGCETTGKRPGRCRA